MIRRKHPEHGYGRRLPSSALLAPVLAAGMVAIGGFGAVAAAYGDVDGDGNVNASDVRAAGIAVFGQSH